MAGLWNWQDRQAWGLLLALGAQGCLCSGDRGHIWGQERSIRGQERSYGTVVFRRLPGREAITGPTGTSG